ncbi:efflux RND transporter permease subunit [Spiribacter halobius]|uniref:efflux RND transporter permease subunit n=1 Tax=Sediminicurvatus halobius TaxID=2182432 RepID=UPI0018EE6039|nr:efflux RND transporter permease subunit [Spiribacter halobius]UEX79367.1 efflux RND transporter permease subunit [Spiribacter halobius]
MYRRLIDNHILATLAMVLVLAAGSAAYLLLPRQQDPSVNFNWVEVQTTYPGASARDVERRVTEVLEDAVARIPDIRFSASDSRAGFSRIVVRFRDLDEDEFDERLTDLRREVQAERSELPDAAEQPVFIEATSDNFKPAAMVLVVGEAYDGNLRARARRIADELERFSQVERVDSFGLRDRELQVRFDPERMQGLGLQPSALADTVSAYFRDVAAGTVGIGEQSWLVRFTGTANDPAYLGDLPIVAAAGEVPLRSVATVRQGFAEAEARIRHQGDPAVMLAVYRGADGNVLRLVDEISAYQEGVNAEAARTGVRMVLLDDRTGVTRNALAVMEGNALVGLGLVLVTTWLFLGGRIALLAALGIPFVLAGVFLLLLVLGYSLNVVVLLGIVISLGMLVDDAVVVVEAVYHRLVHGAESILEAVLGGLREVGAPVLAAVLTTSAAFLPLTLVPGVLGDFMRLAPIVVVCALALSLLEAFWMLPSHLLALRPNPAAGGRIQALRERWTRQLRLRYGRALVAALRRPRLTAITVLALFVAAIGVLQAGLLRVDFFATDSARLVYVDAELPAGTRLEKTLEVTRALEAAALGRLGDGELRRSASVAGVQFTDAEPLVGDEYGQVTLSLHPRTRGGRSVEAIVDDLRPQLAEIPGPTSLSFQQVTTGPPTEPPVNVKLRGDDLERLAAAADAMQSLLAEIPGVREIRDDDAPGRLEYRLRLDADAMVRTGLDPARVIRDIRLLVDGEIVASMQDQGDTLDVRVRADRDQLAGGIRDLGRSTLSLPDGRPVALSELVHSDTGRGRAVIRHYNFRRAISVQAELDEAVTDTVSVNRAIAERWAAGPAERFPDVQLDFTGELDDIQESLSSLALLFLAGTGLVYLILATQFRSYLQPLIILAAVPMAFTGVVFGLLASGSVLSLYTLYGVIALAGIAVNAGIVLVSTANTRARAGATPSQAIVLAARRRVVPVLITSLTTIAGLFALATGLAGESLIWGPVAASIVFGLAVSTPLTLFVTPLLYRPVAPRAEDPMAELPAPPLLERRRGLRGLLGRLRSGRSASPWRADLAALRADARTADAYQTGCLALAAGRRQDALKQLQWVAERLPESGLANRAAAQAALAVVEEMGWDEGYANRARRFLVRARRAAGDTPEIIALLRLYRRLASERGEEV